MTRNFGKTLQVLLNDNFVFARRSNDFRHVNNEPGEGFKTEICMMSKMQVWEIERDRKGSLSTCWMMRLGAVRSCCEKRFGIKLCKRCQNSPTVAKVSENKNKKQTAVIDILNLHIFWLRLTWLFVCTLHTFSKVINRYKTKLYLRLNCPETRCQICADKLNVSDLALLQEVD